MPRESESYRDELQGLIERFGENKNNLTCREVAIYCGISYNTAKNRYAIGSEGIAMRTLARKMSNLHERKRPRKARAKRVPVS